MDDEIQRLGMPREPSALRAVLLIASCILQDRSTEPPERPQQTAKWFLERPQAQTALF
jgi:hypothetical protein